MIGTLISRYKILAEIGRGAMGIVFRAEDTASGQLVAVKILAEKLVNDPEMLNRFSREGGPAAALRHPNICTVFESGDWRGRPYLTMELLHGQTLDHRVGNVPAAQAITIGLDVTSALEATHAIGIVHRDIKPGNLFLTSEGLVKVLDFGLAKVRLPRTPVGEDAPTAALFVTRVGTVLGTIAYMSPEQICCEALDGRADLYSLGVSLHELATGELPFPGSERKVGLPEELARVIRKLTARAAGDRYQTAREAHEALLSAGKKAYGPPMDADGRG